MRLKDWEAKCEVKSFPHDVWRTVAPVRTEPVRNVNTWKLSFLSSEQGWQERRRGPGEREEGGEAERRRRGGRVLVSPVFVPSCTPAKNRAGEPLAALAGGRQDVAPGPAPCCINPDSDLGTRIRKKLECWRRHSDLHHPSCLWNCLYTASLVLKRLNSYFTCLMH